jgi:hypothetical protein
VLLQPAAGGAIVRIRFVQCWMSSATSIGFQTIAAGGVINDVLLDQCELSDNPANGVDIGTGTLNLKVRGCAIYNNGSATGIAIGAGVDGVTITDNTIGNDAGWGSGSQAYGIFFSGAVTRFVLSGNTFKNNVTAQLSGVPALTASAIGPNAGIDDVAPTIASAASITLNWNPGCKISGTTTVTTISGGWAGRSVRFMKTDAGPVTIGGGGNVPLAHTLVQNGSLTLTWDGTAWY